MSTTPNRWAVRCDRADYRCSTQPVEVEAASLARLRAGLRDRGWHFGPWRQWGDGHREYCPACVAYVKAKLAEQATWNLSVG